MNGGRRHVGLGDLEPGPWWIAHEYPERPVDAHCVWSWDCEPCMFHLIAAAAMDPDRYAEEFAVHGSMATTTVAATLLEARLWRAEHGLRAL